VRVVTAADHLAAEHDHHDAIVGGILGLAVAGLSAYPRAAMETCAALLVGALVTAVPGPASAQLETAPFNERPADAHIVISNSHRYEGTFALGTLARVCGEVPAELNFAGVPSFIVQFYPETDRGEIRDITIGSNELLAGETSTSAFHLSVVVYSPEIGSPPAYVLDTSQPGMTGTAELSFPAPGELVLTVKGSNEMDEDIELVLDCKPRGEAG
jgi:hypothetical protein